jgi:DNA-binding IclR family transcriptional regulator
MNRFTASSGDARLAWGSDWPWVRYEDGRSYEGLLASPGDRKPLHSSALGKAFLGSGYFVTRGENVPDATAVARTMFVEAEPVGICVAGPTHRMEPKITAIGAALAQRRRWLPLAVTSSPQDINQDGP